MANGAAYISLVSVVPLSIAHSHTDNSPRISWQLGDVKCSGLWRRLCRKPVSLHEPLPHVQDATLFSNCG